MSAGGDQGSDFETFEVGPGGSSPYFGIASDRKVVFACSIEKNYKGKIKKDVAAVAKSPTKEMTFFSNSSIAIGIRHKLQEDAMATHGIILTIFDSYAISELLADPEIFWIATQFLSIPSDIFLLTPTTEDVGWYENAKKLRIDPDRSSPAEFSIVKRAVRHATKDHMCQSDLPALIEKLRMFRANQMPGIARRAFYEEFVASLRGLELVKDCADGLREYISDVPNIGDTAELEDAAVLIHYAAAAVKRGLLGVPLDEILNWRKLLMERIETLLREDISPGRRSSLSDVKGYLTLLDWVQEVAKDQKINVIKAASES